MFAVVQVPVEISDFPETEPYQVTELSPSARMFLLNLAHAAHNESEHAVLGSEQADSSDDFASEDEAASTERLTWDALKLVFSVLPAADEQHPWADPPSFKVIIAL